MGRFWDVRDQSPTNVMSSPKSGRIGYAVFLDHIQTPELLRAHSVQLRTIIGKLLWVPR